jgi:hypothetical protein
MLEKLRGIRPQVAPTAFVHQAATLIGDTRHEHSQTTRGGVPLHVAVFDGCIIEALGHACREGLGQNEQRFRRQFLGADLDQKVTFAHAALSASAVARFNIGKPNASRVL